MRSRISLKLIFASCVGYFDRAYYGFYVASSRMLYLIVLTEGDKIWQLWNSVWISQRCCPRIMSWKHKTNSRSVFFIDSLATCNQSSCWPSGITTEGGRRSISFTQAYTPQPPGSEYHAQLYTRRKHQFRRSSSSHSNSKGCVYNRCADLQQRFTKSHAVPVSIYLRFPNNGQGLVVAPVPKNASISSVPTAPPDATRYHTDYQ